MKKKKKIDRQPIKCEERDTYRVQTDRQKQPTTSLYIGGPDNAELEAYVRAQEANDS